MQDRIDEGQRPRRDFMTGLSRSLGTQDPAASRIGSCIMIGDCLMRKTSLASLGAVILSGCAFAAMDQYDPVQRGQTIFAQECAQCHGAAGEGAGPASLGLGVAAPDLVGLTARNGGTFPRNYVRRFIMGIEQDDDPDAAMPAFSRVGLRHVYPDGGADGEVLEADFEALLSYLESIQVKG